jgi:4-hydroxybenzoate polyprenyltransferase
MGLLLADTLFLDWLDRKGDQKQKIKTLAVGLPLLGRYFPWAITLFIFVSAIILFLIGKLEGRAQPFYLAFIFSTLILMGVVLLSARVKPKNRFWINYGFEAWRICFALIIIMGR